VTAEGAPGSHEAEAAARDFMRDLAHEDLVLLDVRDELYGGDWGELEADLRARHAGKPHIFRLMTKIEEDLTRLETLRSYEAARQVDLGEVRRKALSERARADQEHEAGEAGSGGPAK